MSSFWHFHHHCHSPTPSPICTPHCQLALCTREKGRNNNGKLGGRGWGLGIAIWGKTLSSPCGNPPSICCSSSARLRRAAHWAIHSIGEFNKVQLIKRIKKPSQWLVMEMMARTREWERKRKGEPVTAPAKRITIFSPLSQGGKGKKKKKKGKVKEYPAHSGRACICVSVSGNVNVSVRC